MTMSVTGLMLTIVGFWGFLMACVIVIILGMQMLQPQFMAR